MMRQYPFLLIVALAFVAFTLFSPASAASAVSAISAAPEASAMSGASAINPDLQKLISDNEDVRMDVMDLAFFLATHNYDATPRDGYVEVDLDGVVYRAVPNGAAPGLADIEIAIIG